MRQLLHTLSDSLVDRLVPRAQAAAASCWTEWRCVRGSSTSGCASTGHEWWQTRSCCSDGSCTAWAFNSCADCR
ncbi:hypothetical protein [Streptomyces sp. GC420]|uniref:hypothetical protein n=1 Tax=Streptomyces sp. GC420 TaxID=2697568 RepID=UPI001414E6F2|nr:hypothetical protein [Streptomyces sp. GC420]NBM14643.1 hypothetical protein [Streptomyces sp. GC420]